MLVRITNKNFEVRKMKKNKTVPWGWIMRVYVIGVARQWPSLTSKIASQAKMDMMQHYPEVDDRA